MAVVMDQPDTSKPPFPTLLPFPTSKAPFPTLLPFPQFTPEPPTAETSQQPSPPQPALAVDNSLNAQGQMLAEQTDSRPLYVPFLENNMHSGTDPPASPSWHAEQDVQTSTPSVNSRGAAKVD